MKNIALLLASTAAILLSSCACPMAKKGECCAAGAAPAAKCAKCAAGKTMCKDCAAMKKGEMKHDMKKAM